MSAPKNMAKRTAAGTLALAVCLSGGALVFAGAANANVTTPIASITSGGSQSVAVAPSDTGDAVADIVYNSSALVTDATTAGNLVTFTLGGVSVGATVATLPTATLVGGVGAVSLVVASVDPTHFTVALPDSHGAAAGTLTLSGMTLAGGRVAQTAGSLTLTGQPASGGGFPTVTLGTATASGLAFTDVSVAAGNPATEISKTTGQKLDDAAVTLPAASSWATGDRVVFQLPAGVTFSGTPTVTASKVSGTGTVVPTFGVTSASTTDDPTTGATDAVAASRRVIVAFTNSKATSAAEAATVWKLTLSGAAGLTVDVSSGYTGGTGGDSISFGNTSANATTDTNGKVYAQTVNNNSGGYTTSLLVTTGTPVPLAYIVPASISVPSGVTYTPNGGLQSAPTVTVTEALATSLASGTVGIKFVDANGGTLPLDGSSQSIGADAFAPTLKVNGTAITTGNFSIGSGIATTPSITATSSIDTVAVGNLRFTGGNVTGGTVGTGQPVGPIQAELYTLAGAAPSVAVNGTPGNLPVSGTIAVSNPSVRYGGSDRYGTGAQILTQAYGGSTFTGFVLADGDGMGVDALSANYVSGKKSEPLVLTQSSALPAASLAWIQGHIHTAGTPTSPQTITFDLMGGTTAISQSVIDQLNTAYPLSAGYKLVFNRNAGANRYETAANAATNVGAANISAFSGSYGTAAVRTAIIASGENPADAVVGGSISHAAGFPLLLTQSKMLSAPSQDAILSLGIKQVIVLGGPSAISPDVLTTLKGLGVNVITVSGANRFETATKVADWARTPMASTTWTTGAGLGYDGAGGTPALPTWTANGTSVLLGNGTSYADVLAAGQLSGVAGAYQPILTTFAAPLADPANTWLVKHKADIPVNGVNALGGGAVITPSTLDAANTASN